MSEQNEEVICPQCRAQQIRLSDLGASMVGQPARPFSETLDPLTAQGKSVSELFSDADCRQLLERFPMAVTIFHAPTNEPKDLTMVFCNESASLSLQRPVSAVLGKTMEEIFPLALESFNGEVCVASHYITALNTDNVISTTTVYGDEILPDSTFFVHFVPVENRLASSVYENITEKSRRQNDLVAFEMRFRGTFEQAAVGFAHMESSGSLIRINRRFSNLLGYARDEVETLSIFDLLHPDDIDEYRTQIHRLLRREVDSVVIEKQIFRKDGSIVWGKLTTTVQFSSTADPQFLIVVFEDISTRKRTELLLQRQMKELEQTNQELDDFAYIASHDLRSPLNGIKHLAQWLTEDIGDTLPEDSQSHLQLLLKRTERLEQMLNELLSYSRVGRKDYGVQEVDLESFFTDLISLGHVGQEFVFDVVLDVKKVRVPEIPLRHVLHNLITNAVKHHHQPPGKITLSAKETARSYIFTVADDGPGIPKSSQQRIFRIFQTLKAREDGAGSGVGLAIVNKTLSYYHGAILLDSVVGKGSTFKVVWPKAGST